MKRYLLQKLVSLLFVCACSRTSTEDLLAGKNLLAGATPVDLLAPANFTVAKEMPTLVWSARTGVVTYRVQVSPVNDFSQLLVNKPIKNTSYQIAASDLIGATELDARIYYWRIIVDQSEKLTSNVFAFHKLSNHTLYVNGASTSTLQVGNKSAPFKTISSAIIQADLLRNGDTSETWDIMVAAGTYADELSMRSGIRVFGGYNAADWTRNIVTNLTQINGIGDRVVAFLNLGNTHATTTGFDGLTLIGAANFSIAYAVFASNSGYFITNSVVDSGPGTPAGIAAAYGVAHYGTGNATIENNTIHSSCPNYGSGGGGVGVYVQNSTSTIRNNTINFKNIACIGGGSPGVVAVFVEGASTVAVENNFFTRTNGSRVGMALKVYHTLSGASVTFKNNIVVYPASQNSSSSTLLSINNGNVEVVDNTFDVAFHTNAHSSLLSQSYSQLTVARNKFHAYSTLNLTALSTSYTSPNFLNNEILVVAPLAKGVRASNSSTPVVVNNTICAVSTLDSVSQQAHSISLATSGASVVNNILCTGAQGTTTPRFAFFEEFSSSNPKPPLNNAIWDFLGATGANTYLDYGTGTACGSNATCYTNLTFEGISPWQGGGTSSGNILLPPGASGNPFANIPKSFSITTAAGTTTTVAVFSGAGFANNDYIELDGDGVARQITLGGGTTTLTFTPPLAVASTMGTPIRNWGNNNTNLAMSFILQQNALPSADWLNIRYGGRNTANSVCGNGAESCGNVTVDRANAIRTAVAGGAANAGAAGYSIGAQESD
ncbi:MAG: hypothetical protein LDLANPLL_00304 [Turneriella sp.]|nr:hypothetical protein [Turneriella sp.]